jgi:hypothetical protein
MVIKSKFITELHTSNIFMQKYYCIVNPCEDSIYWHNYYALNNTETFLMAPHITRPQAILCDGPYDSFIHCS